MKKAPQQRGQDIFLFEAFSFPVTIFSFLSTIFRISWRALSLPWSSHLKGNKCKLVPSISNKKNTCDTAGDEKGETIRPFPTDSSKRFVLILPAAFCPAACSRQISAPSVGNNNFQMSIKSVVMEATNIPVWVTSRKVICDGNLEMTKAIGHSVKRLSSFNESTNGYVQTHTHMECDWSKQAGCKWRILTLPSELILC